MTERAESTAAASAGDHGRGPAAAEAEAPIPLRTQVAIYATGAFANSNNNVVSVILPLWAVALGASPFMIGVLLGIRHLLPTILAIHGGVLMDRLGTRRVLLWFGAIGAVTPLLFPALPWLWAAVLLQALGGLSSTFGWMGAQAQIGEVMKGSAVHAGRLSFALRFGQLAAPLLAGLTWDTGGKWAAFGFLAFWGTCLFVAATALPRPVRTEAPPRIKAADLLPRWQDYVSAFRMTAIPAILLVVMVTVVRMANNGVQSSFYVVYLEQVGYTGTIIGVLLGAGSVLGFAGALSVGPLTRFIQPYWLLIGAVGGGILCVAVTPLVGGIFALLLAASALKGGAMGLSQPLMISILSKAAGKGQGKGVGLRTTCNRLSSLTIPMIMGGVVELVGIQAGFLVIGAVLLVLIGAIAWHVKRSPGFQV